ncbi:MAG: HAMP domain-containing histidine kinase [Dysgonamonadaceae bacterium]|jgi:two-component sensor histidine kinase|nr:HAMP domain-containing histidine kinase [Dysgonamonadaceae bacterium]
MKKRRVKNNDSEYRHNFKYLFVITAIIIAISSIWITNVLVQDLSKEERKKIELWAESVKLMTTQDLDVDPDVFNEYNKLISNIILGNTTIPLVLVDEDGNITPHNITNLPEHDQEEFLRKKLEKFRKTNPPIILDFGDGTFQYIYYDDSTALKSLTIFPYAQLGVVFVFIVISFLALLNAKKAEQNKVWIGLSKETAHQLGTPISSLMGWMEYLKTKNVDTSLLSEMGKDVNRLNVIAERFSKIGSDPELDPMDVNEAIRSAVDYVSKRVSSKVSINCNFPDRPFLVLMNESLFGWVIENLIKNAVDAMDGKGNINIEVTETGKLIKIDISDTGKGIPKSKFKTVFHPGYTTKKRGWGLGLSLVKRIIQSYQHGKIFVLKSEINKGTTFRIELKKYK